MVPKDVATAKAGGGLQKKKKKRWKRASRVTIVMENSTTNLRCLADKKVHIMGLGDN